MSRLTTKPTKWYVRPAKTQISLGIRPVWSESSLCAQRVAKDPSFLHADSENFAQTAQSDLSLRWARMPFCWFCHEAAQRNYTKIHDNTLMQTKGLSAFLVEKQKSD